MILRVKSTLTQFPTNSFYTPMDNNGRRNAWVIFNIGGFNSYKYKLLTISHIHSYRKIDYS